MGILKVLSGNGHDVAEWTTTPELIAAVEEIFEGGRTDLGRFANIDEAHAIALADAEFRALKALGYRTEKVMDPAGTANDAEITHKFDYEAAQIFAAPQTQGG